MRRARYPQPERESITPWAPAKPERKRSGPSPTSEAKVEKCFEEAEAMRASNDWSRATASHFVALYALCHQHVYGVRPGELEGKQWTLAANAARRWLDEFSDPATALDLVRWSWAREQRAHAKNGGERRRMGWRLQFSKALLTDYKVAVLSKDKRPRQEQRR